MTDKPKTFAITYGEGEDWVPFVHANTAGMREHRSKIHAAMFEDGSIWDAVGGWRPQHKDDRTPAEIRTLWKLGHTAADCTLFGQNGEPFEDSLSRMRRRYSECSKSVDHP